MPPVISVALNENKTIFASFGCKIEFPLSRRNSLRTLKTVMTPKNPHVYCALTDLVKIYFIWPVIGSRKILEQEYLEKMFQKRIAMNELPY